MKVVLATSGKFHIFDLARQLYKRNFLERIYTGYPVNKLKNEGLPMDLIESVGFSLTAYHLLARTKIPSALKNPLSKELAWKTYRAIDAKLSREPMDYDILMSLSETVTNAATRAVAAGKVFVCDRGSSHIQFQNQILHEEYQLQGQRFKGIDERVIARHLEEYAIADAITVPSYFVKRSFLEMGVAESKVQVVPYGVDLSRFHPTSAPPEGEFNVLFVGNACIRKGVVYLLQAFEALQHPRKQLNFVGAISPEVRALIENYASRLPIACLGIQPQDQLKHIMSASHVLVLPSVEEGLALVQAQAMACGCPVIGTTNSGAENLLEDGVEGFIVAIRDAQAIASRLQTLADDPDKRAQMSRASLKRVQEMGGWDTYGDNMVALFARLLESKNLSASPANYENIGENP